MKIELLLIDPQEDFCNPETGSLYVNGAEKDMDRLADMIKNNVDRIDDINITMDSHHEVDLAHPIFWVDKDGKHPDPFTIISRQDIVIGKWTPSVKKLRPRMLEYTEKLASNKRYPLCIWPPHCIIGTEGHAIYKSLRSAIGLWERRRKAVPYFIAKGSNVFTEHYSAVRAEVEDPKDPSTKVNPFFENLLRRVDELWVGGEAGSHCVANTLLDIYNAIENKEDFKKVIWMEDAISPVEGFENLQKEAVEKLTEKGMRISKTIFNRKG